MPIAMTGSHAAACNAAFFVSQTHFAKPPAKQRKVLLQESGLAHFQNKHNIDYVPFLCNSIDYPL